MWFRRTPDPGPGAEAEGPVNLDSTSHPSYTNFIKSAGKAGAKGIPDPRYSTAAPSCFDALLNMAEDQVHHEFGRMLADIASARKIVDTYGDLEARYASKSSMTEKEERIVLRVRAARAEIREAVDRYKPRFAAIVSNFNRTRADMQQAYLKQWIYAAHFDKLSFPDLDLKDLRYDDGLGGLDVLGAPSQPDTPQMPIPRIKEVGQ